MNSRDQLIADQIDPLNGVNHINYHHTVVYCVTLQQTSQCPLTTFKYHTQGNDQNLSTILLQNVKDISSQRQLNGYSENNIVCVSM